MCFFFFFLLYRHPPILNLIRHSFPTRRSSHLSSICHRSLMVEVDKSLQAAIYNNNNNKKTQYHPQVRSGKGSVYADLTPKPLQAAIWLSKIAQEESRPR